MIVTMSRNAAIYVHAVAWTTPLLEKALLNEDF